MAGDNIGLTQAKSGRAKVNIKHNFEKIAETKNEILP
jgi:hypothetical protein